MFRRLLLYAILCTFVKILSSNFKLLIFIALSHIILFFYLINLLIGDINSRTIYINSSSFYIIFYISTYDIYMQKYYIPNIYSLINYTQCLNYLKL